MRADLPSSTVFRSKTGLSGVYRHEETIDGVSVNWEALLVSVDAQHRATTFMPSLTRRPRGPGTCRRSPPSAPLPLLDAKPSQLKLE